MPCPLFQEPIVVSATSLVIIMYSALGLHTAFFFLIQIANPFHRQWMWDFGASDDKSNRLLFPVDNSALLIRVDLNQV